MKYIKFLTAFLAGAGLFIGTGIAIASVTFTIPTQPDHTYKNFSFFNGATTTAMTGNTAATSTNTSDGGGYLVIAGAKKVELYFSHGGVATTSTGTSTFAIQVSPDGTNWYNYSKLLTGSSTVTVATVDIKGATSTVHAVMNDYLLETYYAIRCIVSGSGTVGQQGEHTCAASAEF